MLGEFNEALLLDPPKNQSISITSAWLNVNWTTPPEAIVAFEQAIDADNNFALPHKELTIIYLQLKPDQTRASYHAKRFQKLSKTPFDSSR